MTFHVALPGVSVHSQSGVPVPRTYTTYGGGAGHVSFQTIQGGADPEYGPCGQRDCESGAADFQTKEKAGWLSSETLCL